jgi:hypothetical protein
MSQSDISREFLKTYYTKSVFSVYALMVSKFVLKSSLVSFKCVTNFKRPFSTSLTILKLLHRKLGENPPTAEKGIMRSVLERLFRIRK